MVKGPSGLVVAADSRVTLTAQPPAGGAAYQVHFDNASKLLRFGSPHNFVAAVTYGQALVPGQERTAESFLPELQAALPQQRLTVDAFAQAVSDFYVAQWGAAMTNYQGDPMIFGVAGFDENAPYGRTFLFQIPNAPAPVEQLPGAQEFGATWGGQTEIVDRILKGYQTGLDTRIVQALGLGQPQTAQLQQTLGSEQMVIPIGVMALQDCVNLAITLIRTTIAMQQLSVGIRGVGGPIDIVTITRTEGIRPVRFKEVTADV